MSSILLGILNSQASGGSSYFFTVIGGSGNDYGQYLLSDNNGSLIFVTQSDSFGTEQFVVGKIDPSTGLSSSLYHLGGAAIERPYRVASDSSGNVFGAGFSSYISGANQAVAFKYNSDLSSVLFQKDFGGGSNDDYFFAVDTDSNANAYYSGVCRSAGVGNGDNYLVKLNSSGAVQWERALGDSNTNNCEGVSTNGAYTAIAGRTKGGGFTSQDITVSLWDDTGNVVWQRRAGHDGADDYGYKCFVDANTNVYVTGFARPSNSTQRVAVQKWDSSGTLVWERYLLGDNSTIGRDIVADDEGNVYVVANGPVNSLGGNQMIVVKYDSNGVIQWQRYMGQGNSQNYPTGITIGDNGELLISGWTNVLGHLSGLGGYDAIFASLPADGSLTGNYTLYGVPWSWQPGNAVDAAGTSPTYATGFTTAITNLFNGDTSFTNASGSLTEATTAI